MRHFLQFLLACVCVSAHAAGNAGDAVAMFRAGPALAGVYAAAPADWIDGIRFAFDAGSPLRSAPAVYRGSLYFGSGDGSFFALDARTGAQRWRLQTGGAITSSPAAANGRVYFASRDGALYCADARSGAILWRHRFAPDLGPQNYWDYYQSSPTLDRGTLFIGSGDGRVYALDAATGRVRWAADAGSRVRSTVAVHDGLVVFGTMSGHVRALDRRDGRLRWSFATAGAARKFEDKGNDTTSVFGSPTIAGNAVVVGGRDGFLYALDLATGRQLWRTTHDGSSWILSSAFDGETVYIGSGSALIVQAADPATGAERWRFRTPGAVFGSPVLAGDTLLYSDLSGVLQALDKRTGAARWQFPLGGRSLSTPVVAGGIVYASSDAGVMFALSIADARPVAAAPRRIVYREGMTTPAAFSWFKGGVDAAILAQLQAAGYEQLDAAQLEAFMRQQSSSPAPGVVVFTDNKIPSALANDTTGPALIRHYLDAGGKVALLGPNPLAFRADAATGQVTEIDYAVPARVFGVVYPEPGITGGYYVSLPTSAGRTMGLRSASISYQAIDPGRTDNLTVLARDEFGKASAWLKRYGGPPGTGLLQLTVPRLETFGLAEFQAVIEYGVTW